MSKKINQRRRKNISTETYAQHCFYHKLISYQCPAPACGLVCLSTGQNVHCRMPEISAMGKPIIKSLVFIMNSATAPQCQDPILLTVVQKYEKIKTTKSALLWKHVRNLHRLLKIKEVNSAELLQKANVTLLPPIDHTRFLLIRIQELQQPKWQTEHIRSSVWGRVVQGLGSRRLSEGPLMPSDASTWTNTPGCFVLVTDILAQTSSSVNQFSGSKSQLTMQRGCSLLSQHLSFNIFLLTV